MNNLYVGKRQEAILWMLMSIPLLIGSTFFLLTDRFMPVGESTLGAGDRFFATMSGFVCTLFFVKMGRIRAMTTEIGGKFINVTYYSGKAVSFTVAITDEICIDHKMTLLHIGNIKAQVPLPFSQTYRLIAGQAEVYINLDKHDNFVLEKAKIIECLRHGNYTV